MKKLFLLATLSAAFSIHAVNANAGQSTCADSKLAQALAAIESFNEKGHAKYNELYNALIDSEAFKQTAAKAQELAQSPAALDIADKVSPVITPILETMKNIKLAEKAKVLAALYIACKIIPATAHGAYVVGKGLASGAWSVTKATTNLGWGLTKGAAHVAVSGAKGVAHGAQATATRTKKFAGKCRSFLSKKKEKDTSIQAVLKMAEKPVEYNPTDLQEMAAEFPLDPNLLG